MVVRRPTVRSRSAPPIQIRDSSPADSDALDVLLRSRASQVVIGLQVHPELWRGAQLVGKEPRRLRSDATLPVDDFVDALNGNAELLGELRLRDLQGNEELLKEHLSGMGRDSVFGNLGGCPCLL